jgi:predicted Rossmann fold flavoprotein
VIDVIVLGAGAAGLMCASVAASQGRRVVVLEHNDRPGKKIRISGGGRCNFTNVGTTHRQFISRNPEFCRSALSRYTPQDFLSMVERHGIAWHEKKLGQLFCDGSAQQIIDMLVNECRAAGVEFHYGINVRTVRKADTFIVETSSSSLHARSVVVATGGLSIPSLGASDIGYRIARHFGVPIVPTEPALVPFVFDATFADRWSTLAGISVDAIVTASGPPFRENILFTHRGLSGPAILQASSYWSKGEQVTIDLLPDTTSADIIPTPNREPRTLSAVLSAVLPKRMIDVWEDPTLQRRVDQTPRRDLDATIAALHAWTIAPFGTEGYAKAEVTRGGVDTAALSQRTMECAAVPGLYFIGEVVDVTGWLGGYNFQWAWASGHAAGAAAGAT